MGQPIQSHVWILKPESIGLQSDTREGETSQYPVEKKTTVIPSVVASESGTA